jgi:hypothetical protein
LAGCRARRSTSPRRPHLTSAGVQGECGKEGAPEAADRRAQRPLAARRRPRRREGVAQIASQIIPRGWEFDREYSSEDHLTWYYPPSAIEVDDDDERTEAITRIWVSDPDQPNVILVGEGGINVAMTVEQLFERLDVIEAYRAGDAEPELG